MIGGVAVGLRAPFKTPFGESCLALHGETLAVYFVSWTGMAFLDIHVSEVKFAHFLFYLWGYQVLSMFC